MDWRTAKFDWNRARAFLITAEEGSLSAAAKALGTTQPTLGRQVTALEEELGIALFERVGRGLELTPGGLELVEHVRIMGEAASRLSMAASGQSDSIEGSICITATEAMALFVLPPIIQKLRRRQPGIQIELIASNSTSDLKRREADIAIRAFRPTQPDLIAKKVGEDAARLYATPDYIGTLGYPELPKDLGNAEFLGFDQSNTYINALNALGFNLTTNNFPVCTENHLVHWELTKQGIGIGIMPDYIGDPEPLVARVLPNYGSIPVEIWLVAHRELKTSRRVRMVFDFLDAELSKTADGRSSPL